MTATPAPSADESFLSRVGRQTRHALTTGGVQPIATTERCIEDGGVRFIVRSVSTLARKRWDALAPAKAATPSNPFLPYDPDVFVADVPPAHVCLLNKFPVIDGHVLIVTRAFEHQDRLLSRDDFQALFACLIPTDGLGFYNGGTRAGASQSHKHLQVVPLPLAADGGPPVPMAARLSVPSLAPSVPVAIDLPFRHRVVRLDRARTAGVEDAAPLVHDLYRRMLNALGIGEVEAEGDRRASAPYNLVLTRDWMLLVPRSREHAGSVSVNALGFAGSLFVRDEEEMAFVEETGPMTVLARVALTP